MADSLRTNYPRTRRVEVLPILYALTGDPTRRERRSNTTSQPTSVVLGHLSNLSIAKGLEQVFDTVQLMHGRGKECRLLIAGPSAGREDREVLERRLLQAGGLAWHLGPVQDDSRERFFDDIDVFLFPSRYRHESFGLVVGEALSRGCPVVTFETACLSHELVGQAGLVLPLSEPFSERAAAWISEIWEDPRKRASVLDAAAGFSSKRNQARAQARALARSIVRVTRDGIEPPRLASSLEVE
jgi:glycosyltransferase involved in cell wall biosynthesis